MEDEPRPNEIRVRVARWEVADVTGNRFCPVCFEKPLLIIAGFRATAYCFNCKQHFMETGRVNNV